MHINSLDNSQAYTLTYLFARFARQGVCLHLKCLAKVCKAVQLFHIPPPYNRKRQCVLLQKGRNTHTFFDGLKILLLKGSKQDLVRKTIFQALQYIKKIDDKRHSDLTETELFCKVKW